MECDRVLIINIIVNNLVALDLYLYLPLQNHMIIGEWYVLGGFMVYWVVFSVYRLEIANRTAQLFYILCQMYSNLITLAICLICFQPFYIF